MPKTILLVPAAKYDAEVARSVLRGESVELTVEDVDTAAELAEVARRLEVEAVVPGRVGVADGLLAVPSLEAVGLPGTGVGGFDFETAVENGVTVVNAPTYAVEEVSTHALALLLACVRRLPRYDDAVRAGEWDWQVGRPVHRLAGRTLGLVGFGSIARRAAEKAAAFGLDVVAYDPYVDAGEMADCGVEKVAFDALLDRAELLSLHAPQTEETRGLFDADAFDRLGDGVVLVNTGRGPVVEEAALLAALEDGTVDAAGLDVFETEPLRDSPLVDRDDVVLSPHVGWYSEESRDDCIRSVTEDLLAVLEGGEPRGEVDPEADWL